MAQRVAFVVVVPGTPRAGIWCQSCALPSVVEVDVWALMPSGLRKLGTVTRCAEADHGDR